MKSLFIYINILLVSFIFIACSNTNIKRDSMMSPSPIFKIEQSSKTRSIQIIEEVYIESEERK